MLVISVHETGCDHEVRGGLIDRHRNVVDLSDTHQGLHIRIVRLCRQRIGKEYYKVNHAFYDLGSDLLVTAERAAVVTFYGKTGLVRDHAGRCAGAVKITAPMPGKIVAVKAQAGASVKKGDAVLVLEAMKMENEICAAQDGVIASVEVAVGDMVEGGDVLATMN